MQLEFYERIAQLGREGRSFAIATVVARQAPVSSHLGDHAIVFADGRMEGFIGGACSREIVRVQALEALAGRHSRIVSIRPDAERSQSNPDHVFVSMTCASEGAVDVYIEPFVRARLLVVVGATPIAAALARVGRSLEYRVVRVIDGRELDDIASHRAMFGYTAASIDALHELLARSVAESEDCAVVVASQGHYDEETLATALKCGVAYVGLVASRSRGAIVKALLEQQGVPHVATLRNPAGIDVGAQTAPEVALSILAEIVQASSARTGAGPGASTTRATAAAKVTETVAVDPVCKMRVDISTSRHEAEVGDVTYYFCSAGCRARFLEQPDAFRSRMSE